MVLLAQLLSSFEYGFSMPKKFFSYDYIDGYVQLFQWTFSGENWQLRTHHSSPNKMRCQIEVIIGSHHRILPNQLQAIF